MHEPAETASDAQIADSVEQVLSEAWNSDVRVGERETLREDKCFRYQIETSSLGAPTSVIVKKARREEGCPIDPDSAAPNPVHRFLDEWACLAFLSEIAPNLNLGPKFYG